MTTLLIVVGVGLALSFMCSIMEAVLLSVSHSYIALLHERGERAGKYLADMRENIDEPIAAILTLNTIAHTVGAAVGGALALELWGDRWIALFSAVLTFAILVFSEILPKTLGATYWKLLAPPTAMVLRVMIVVMKPILVPLGLINRLMTPHGEQASTFSRAELEVMAAIGRREGALDQSEWEVVNNLMNLNEVSVGDVMTPRTVMIALPLESTVEQAKDLMLEEGHLRLPVFDGSIDRVVGILLARDLWRADREGLTEVQSIMRPPIFVPESKAVEALIPEMRHQRIKMAIVLDEFGGTAGLVTLEDLIEEIIGEIHDEHEQEPLPFEIELEGEVRIRGEVPLGEVNERFGLALPEEIYDTIGGFVFGMIGRIARVGDEVNIDAGKFRVLKMDGRRIERISFVPAGEREEL
ncbi:MAG TPA: hemolysin family protein [Longimicrobiaceae bacterium]|nr:hemolysin family protein [Longimicrobiaceae bacterium]